MLESHEDFKNRHIGPDADQQKTMLAYLGYGSMDELMSAAVPEVIRFEGAGQLPDPISEAEALK